MHIVNCRAYDLEKCNVFAIHSAKEVGGNTTHGGKGNDSRGKVKPTETNEMTDAEYSWSFP